MEHCKQIPMEVAHDGATFTGERWPDEIQVMRNLLDYLPGPHVAFGRFGVLRFKAKNGYAVYRRLEDIPGGWNYRLVESNLQAKVDPERPVGPRLKKVAKLYAHDNGMTVVAFRWEPHEVPPVELPDWFLGSDFEHINAKGHLLLRKIGQPPCIAVAGDWIVNIPSRGIFPIANKAFKDHYHEV